jgi:hypothetical protein
MPVIVAVTASRPLSLTPTLCATRKFQSRTSDFTDTSIACGQSRRLVGNAPVFHGGEVPDLSLFQLVERHRGLFRQRVHSPDKN